MVILTLCHAAFRFRDGDTYVISSARETTWARWDPKALKVGKPEVQVRQAASQCPEVAGFKVDRQHHRPQREILYPTINPYRESTHQFAWNNIATDKTYNLMLVQRFDGTKMLSNIIEAVNARGSALGTNH